jgi:hypothetical protein
LTLHRRCPGIPHQRQKNLARRFYGTVRRLSPVFLKHWDASQNPFDKESTALAKTNFQYEKRQKDLEKKRKKEEKLKKKADKANQPEGTPDAPDETGDDAEDGSSTTVTESEPPAPGNQPP